MARPPIPHDTKVILAHKWVEYVMVYRKKPSAQLVLDKAREAIKLNGLQEPSLRKVQDILKEINYANEKRTEDQKALDEPWSLAASIKHRIPPEATSDLLMAWRYSLAAGYPLTVREAQWLAYLRNIHRLPEKTGVESTMRLLNLACDYAHRERVCDILQTPCTTSDLDGALVMPPWELGTAMVLGKLSAITWPADQNEQLERLGTDAEQDRYAGATPAAHADSSVDRLVWSESPDLLVAELRERMEEANRYMKEPHRPRKERQELSEEQDLVYAYWLWYLGRGPRWKLLSRAERSGIKCQLLTWVKEEVKKNTKPPGFIIPSQGFWATTAPWNIIDPDLVKLVGYDVPDQPDTKEQ